MMFLVSSSTRRLYPPKTVSIITKVEIRILLITNLNNLFCISLISFRLFSQPIYLDAFCTLQNVPVLLFLFPSKGRMHDTIRPHSYQEKQILISATHIKRCGLTVFHSFNSDYNPTNLLEGIGFSICCQGFISSLTQSS